MYYSFYEVFFEATTEYMGNSYRGKLYLLIIYFGKFWKVRLEASITAVPFSSSSHPQNPKEVCKPMKLAVPPHATVGRAYTVRYRAEVIRLFGGSLPSPLRAFLLSIDTLLLKTPGIVETPHQLL